MIIDSGTTVIENHIMSGTTVQESHIFSGTVVTQFEGGQICEVTYDDGTCLIYDDGSFAEYD